MHQYELMRLLARVSEILSDVASGQPVAHQAAALREDICRAASAWAAEEAEYNEAACRRVSD